MPRCRRRPGRRGSRARRGQGLRRQREAAGSPGCRGGAGRPGAGGAAGSGCRWCIKLDARPGEAGRPRGPRGRELAAKLEPGGRGGGVPPRPPPSPGRRPPPPPSAAGAGGPRPAPRAHGRPRARRLEAADRPRRLPPPPARLPRSSEPAAESPAGRAKRVREGERDPGSWLPPPRRRAPGLRGGSGREVGSERAAEELSRPGSVCTSAGNVPLTYIFFQTYVTFFFLSLSLVLWEETGVDPRKGEAGKRTKGEAGEKK